MAGFQIYLAGPEVFLPDFGNAVLAAKKAMCAASGFVGVSPMDGQLDTTGLSPFEQGVAIYRGNVAHMDRCDAIIANMTPFRGVSMDAGTAFEMGYMAARGKAVLGYTHAMVPFDQRSENYDGHGRPELLETYSAGMSVERFGMVDNLMMAGAVDVAGFGVAQARVPAGEEFTSLAGFKTCLDALGGRRAARGS
jgi:nucleoside 2-deoxyribosyltransferase